MPARQRKAPLLTRRRLVLGFVSLALVIGGVSALRLAEAARSLRQGERSIEGAAEAIADGRIADARASLDRAETALQDANVTLRSSLSLNAIGVLPVVAQNLEALTESVELAATVVHGGRRILDSADQLEGPDGTLQVALTSGSIPIDAVRTARTEVQALLDQLAFVHEEDGSPLLLPLTAELRRSVRTEALHRRTQLDRLSRGLTLLHELVGGDHRRRYLLAVANTAEMRGTGGMMLNYGVLEGTEGGVDLTDFGRVEELALRAPVSPSEAGLPQDFVRRWEGFDMTREWRNATVSGDLTLVAPALEAMYQRATGLPADGVIQVDPAGLAAILEGVGPVHVADLGEVTAENVEALVLNEAYRRFPGVEERADVLGDVAEAAFRRLVEGDFPSVRALAEPIAAAVDGRHIMVHSKTARVQSVLSSFGADGSLPDPRSLDHLHLTVQNMSGNKLDYYLDTAIEVTGSRPGGELGSWNVEVTLTNTAPPGERSPRYIFGPYDASHDVGSYRGAVTLYVPSGTSLQAAEGGPFRLPPSVQTENGRPVVGFWVDVPAGESRTVSLQLRLPPPPTGDDYELLLVPAARVRPTAMSVHIETDRGVAAADQALDRPWLVRAGGPAVAITGG